jgi:hypothetical protein
MPSRMSTTVPLPVVLTALLAASPTTKPSKIQTIKDPKHHAQSFARF